MSGKVKTIIKILIFIISIYLVIYGQKTVGRNYLFIQLIGLNGLIALLWNYNQKFI
ncbi:MAG: hypothetical protein L0L39_03020 [Atopostipes suicloacalis]|nr:hypothetical protein [Atopostipes suicloacalis]MDN6731134.1 hypothetical protein [Atopostipes suicloacalis]